MGLKAYPVIDLAATGDNIRRLRMARGLTVRDLQSYFGFAEPRAIYKWQKGETLPTVDNLYALGALLEVSLEQILIPVAENPDIVCEQQAETCCSPLFSDRLFRMWQASDAASAICPGARPAGVTGHARSLRAGEGITQFFFSRQSRGRACLPHEGDVSSEAGMGVCAKNGSDVCASGAGREAGRCPFQFNRKAR